MFKFCPHNKSSEFINPSTSCHSNMFITNHGTFWYSFFLLPFLFSSGHISNRSFEDFLQEKSAFKEDRIFRNLGHKILICEQNLFMFQINVLLSMQKKQRWTDIQKLCYAISIKPCKFKEVFAHHHEFICTGNEGLEEPANKLPLLPTKDKEDPLEAFLDIVALGRAIVLDLWRSKPPA